MSIETLEDWNDRLACCCGMPVCDTPIQECESAHTSIQRSDYPFNAGENPQGDYPSGEWWNETDGVWRPFVQPAGDEGDPHPIVYLLRKDTFNKDEGPTGTYKVYGYSVAEEDGSSSEYVNTSTVNGFGTESYSWTWQYYDPDGSIGYSESDSKSWGDPGFNEIYWLVPIGLTPFQVCEPAKRETGSIQDETVGDLAGVPIIGDKGPEGTTEAWNIFWKEWDQIDLLEPLTLEQAQTDLLDKLDELPWDDTNNTCSSSLALVTWPRLTDPPPACSADNNSASILLTGNKARFRWQVPVLTYLYYKVTWDVAFFPEDPEVDPTPVLTDQTWEWTGPGDPEDLDTYRSGWYELEPPDEPGEVRVVNIRYQCYRETPYGTPPPQVTGEGIDWPAP